jgi:hypothetical protein
MVQMFACHHLHRELALVCTLYLVPSRRHPQLRPSIRRNLLLIARVQHIVAVLDRVQSHNLPWFPTMTPVLTLYLSHSLALILADLSATRVKFHRMYEGARRLNIPPSTLTQLHKGIQDVTSASRLVRALTVYQIDHDDTLQIPAVVCTSAVLTRIKDVIEQGRALCSNVSSNVRTQYAAFAKDYATGGSTYCDRFADLWPELQRLPDVATTDLSELAKLLPQTRSLVNLSLFNTEYRTDAMFRLQAARQIEHRQIDSRAANGNVSVVQSAYTLSWFAFVEENTRLPAASRLHIYETLRQAYNEPPEPDDEDAPLAHRIVNTEVDEDPRYTTAATQQLVQDGVATTERTTYLDKLVFSIKTNAARIRHQTFGVTYDEDLLSFVTSHAQGDGAVTTLLAAVPLAQQQSRWCRQLATQQVTLDALDAVLTRLTTSATNDRTADVALVATHVAVSGPLQVQVDTTRAAMVASETPATRVAYEAAQTALKTTRRTLSQARQDALDTQTHAVQPDLDELLRVCRLFKRQAIALPRSLAGLALDLTGYHLLYTERDARITRVQQMRRGLYRTLAELVQPAPKPFISILGVYRLFQHLDLDMRVGASLKQQSTTSSTVLDQDFLQCLTKLYHEAVDGLRNALIARHKRNHLTLEHVTAMCHRSTVATQGEDLYRKLSSVDNRRIPIPHRRVRDYFDSLYSVRIHTTRDALQLLLYLALYEVSVKLQLARTLATFQTPPRHELRRRDIYTVLHLAPDNIVDDGVVL